MSNISNMQDMTEAICARTAEGYEKQLKDTRDGQLYWVGKMKDGRCWMLQNLALDLTEDGLKASDTNITSDWNSSSQYKPTQTLTSVTSGSPSNTVVRSWNLGQYVLATPEWGTSCGDSGISGLADCTKVGFVDVSTNFEPTYTATTGFWAGATSASDTLIAVNCTTWSGSGTSRKCTAGTYDPHYLVGNYYSWNAATAGTGGTRTSGQASGSICPKGWKLPTGNTSGEFKTLLSQYGVSSSLSGTVNGTTYNIAGAPLRFVRGGNVPPGSLCYAGTYGFYWSSKPGSSNGNAYSLKVDVSSVNPSYGGGRYDGQSVRCVSE